RENKEGPALLGARPEPREHSADEVVRGLEDGSLTVVDTRPVREVHTGTVPGALSIPALGKAAGHIGWAYDPDTDDSGLVVLAPDAATAAEYDDHFVRVGVDALVGYVRSLEGLPLTVPTVVSPAGLEPRPAGEAIALLRDGRKRRGAAAGPTRGPATQP